MAWQNHLAASLGISIDKLSHLLAFLNITNQYNTALPAALDWQACSVLLNLKVWFTYAVIQDGYWDSFSSSTKLPSFLHIHVQSMASI